MSDDQFGTQPVKRNMLSDKTKESKYGLHEEKPHHAKPLTDEEKARKEIISLAMEIMSIRKRPLLIMYYPETRSGSGGSMQRLDVEYMYNMLVKEIDGKLTALDVLLHTEGGDPHTAYHLAQILHKFADDVTVLVPKWAYSAGTLFSMGSCEIRMSPLGHISPMDIRWDTEDKGTIWAIAVDQYLEFVRDCKRKIQGEDGLKTDIDSHLLGKLVDQIEALTLGNIYRERKVTKQYAEALLSRYMFRHLQPKRRKEIINRVVDKLVFGFATHDFKIDSTLAKELELVIEEMSHEESLASINLIDFLDKLTWQDTICEDIGEGIRVPYFHYVPTNNTEPS